MLYTELDAGVKWPSVRRIVEHLEITLSKVLGVQCTGDLLIFKSLPLFSICLNGNDSGQLYEPAWRHMTPPHWMSKWTKHAVPFWSAVENDLRLLFLHMRVCLKLKEGEDVLFYCFPSLAMYPTL